MYEVSRLFLISSLADKLDWKTSSYFSAASMFAKSEASVGDDDKEKRMMKKSKCKK